MHASVTTINMFSAIMYFSCCYQLSLENVATKETRLLYMTTGVLLQKIVSARSLTQFTHIFIDEVSCWK